MNICRGQWNNPKRYFGLHYDLNARKTDTELGPCATKSELIPLLEQAGVDFVKTDGKGHPLAELL